MQETKVSGGKVKWRLAFFVTAHGDRYGTTGLIGGDYSKLRPGVKPEHLYQNRKQAEREAARINRNAVSFMCWPVPVRGGHPWSVE